ncbi:MAG: sigma-70 family RNA polymerase sigma factor [Clostridia bacterium]|nr:sigma-70 family RNA polymerase sigma factor [Clostridia bacterium]
MELKNAVELAQKGDTKAWTVLFEQTKDMVYFTILKLCGDSTVAEDLTQEAYVKAMENLGALRSPEAFVVWMRQIAVNVSRNYLAKRKPEIFGSDETDALIENMPEVEEGFLPEDYASRRETCRIIMRIIDSLPEKQRLAVIMYYYNEIPVADIAKIMGVSENTVKSRLNYARAQIKEQVEELEKKGTKLHAAVPFLGLVLREAAKDYPLAKGAAASIAGMFATATAATATAATVTATGGIIAKIMALPVLTKVIAGIASVAVLFGAGAAVATTIGGNDTTVVEKREDYINYLTPEQVEEYREFNVEQILDMTEAEIIAKFGDVYQKDVYGNDGYAIEYFYKFINDNDDKYDECVYIRFSNDGTAYPVNVQPTGTLFDYCGIQRGMHVDEVRRILKENGYQPHEDADENEFYPGTFEQSWYHNDPSKVDFHLAYEEADELVFNYILSPSELHYMDVEDEMEESITEALVETEAPIETEAPVETEAPIETEAPVQTETPEETTVVTKGEKQVVAVFRQNDSWVIDLPEENIPQVTLYSDGTIIFRSNFLYTIIDLNGIWTKEESDGYTLYNCKVELYDMMNENDFTIRHQDSSSNATFICKEKAMFYTAENGTNFELVQLNDAPLYKSEHAMLEEYHFKHFPDKVIGRNYFVTRADLTHDGVNEMIITYPTEYYLAQYEVLTVKDGRIESIYTDSSGPANVDMYYHHLYYENGMAYLITAAFFERHGYPWYFYKIYHLDDDGAPIILREESCSVEGMEATWEEIDRCHAIAKKHDEYTENCMCIADPSTLDYIKP